jgi:hypothetical protein
MNRDNALRINATLPPAAVVVDVGGGDAPFPRADYVIDALPFEQRERARQKLLSNSIANRFSKETWVQLDVCDRAPWPFPDKFFDYSVCSHLLEDIRDPVWVCSELQRVSKAGYVETPTRILEQALGVENPRHCGFYHHRWLVDMHNGTVEFRFKPHTLHGLNAAFTCRIGMSETLNPDYSFQAFEWEGSFHAREVLFLTDAETESDLIQFAAHTRALPRLTVPAQLSLWKRLQKTRYWRRLRRGRR